VVDDVTENRHLLSALMTDAGFTVCESSTGRDAIAKWESWKPNLIWMDIRMAGIDGIEATRVIRGRERETGGRCVIIALTASAFDTDRALILDAGCDDFVPKPFLDGVIFGKMKEHLGVRYTYLEDADAEERSSAEGIVASPLDIEALAALPVEWVDMLEQAVHQGDAEAAIDVADQIAMRDAGLADELRRLVRRYRFDEITDALSSIRRGTGV
jgi:CheY-like chemotaxis protein